MNSESVDLIATAPPFNKSADFHATPDSLAASGEHSRKVLPASRWVTGDN